MANNHNGEELEQSRWIQELRRYQSLRSQIYLYGNIYDSYYFPMRSQQSGAAEWISCPTIKILLRKYLESEGYELVCYYDQVDGFSVASTDAAVTKETLVEFLTAQDSEARALFQNTSIREIEKNLSFVLPLFRLLAKNGEKLAAGIVNYASQLVAQPDRLEEEERMRFLRLLKAAEESRPFANRGLRRNLLLFVCNKLNDVPPWVLQSPLVRGIEIQKPDKSERALFFRQQAKRFFESDGGAEEATARRFVELTDGFTNRELDNLVVLSQQERIPVAEIDSIVDLFKYGVRENFWQQLSDEKVGKAHEMLEGRVKGQGKAIEKSVVIIRRAKLGLEAIDHPGTKSRPKGVLFLAGPTGTGKTELAKALASFLFGDEDAIIRFDMSEYNASNSDVKLIGAPPGYVGYDEGGQLTRAVKNRPFSVVLFDEIEKAHPVVFDKFLQILDDGRLTDGKGETVYFTESLIIFTSNLGMFVESEDGKRRIPNVRHGETYDVMAEKIREAIENFFKVELNRPEILNRFGDNFVVFDFIREPIDKSILKKNLETIRANLAKRNLFFEYNDEFVDAFLHHHVRDNLENGGRGINNRVEKYIKNGITNFLFSVPSSDRLQFTVEVAHEHLDDEGRPILSFRAL